MCQDLLRLLTDRPCPAAVRDDRHPDQALEEEPSHLAPAPSSSSGQLPLFLQNKDGARISWLLGVRKDKDRVQSWG